MKRFINFLSHYFFPHAVGIVPAPFQAEFDGAAINLGALISYLTQLSNNAAPQTGQWNFFNDATGTGTWNATSLPPGLASTVVLLSGQAAVSKTTDTALNIVGNGFPGGGFIGQTALAIVANANSAVATLVAGVGVTLAGTTTVINAGARFFQLRITNLANPAAKGAFATNTTTTTAPLAVPAPNAQSVVVPVAANTGIVVGSVLQVTQVDGTPFTGTVSAVATNNITVLGANNKPIAANATVAVFNTTVTLQGMFQIGAGVAA